MLVSPNILTYIALTSCSNSICINGLRLFWTVCLSHILHVPCTSRPVMSWNAVKYWAYKMSEKISSYLCCFCYFRWTWKDLCSRRQCTLTGSYMMYIFRFKFGHVVSYEISASPAIIFPAVLCYFTLLPVITEGCILKDDIGCQLVRVDIEPRSPWVYSWHALSLLWRHCLRMHLSFAYLWYSVMAGWLNCTVGHRLRDI